MSSALLTEKEAGRFLGVSQGWLRQARMRQSRDPDYDAAPPFVRVGARAIRYQRADLESWIERRTVGASR